MCQFPYKILHYLFGLCEENCQNGEDSVILRTAQQQGGQKQEILKLLEQRHLSEDERHRITTITDFIYEVLKLTLRDFLKSNIGMEFGTFWFVR
ncbi:MAG: hypothetical protein NZZ41_03500 [Candidatus Dojkabacteria bacterium]|nr:hypothetical protein [Candidatus Dojkabacteria bacterium]